MTYVIGTGRLYDHWRKLEAGQDERSPRAHRHVSRPDQLRGVRLVDGDRVVLLSKHYDLPDWEQIDELLRIIDMRTQLPKDQTP